MRADVRGERDAAGAVIDFETGYANPAMDRMLGVSIERSFGRRLLEETPAFRRRRDVQEDARGLESGTPAVVETVVESRAGPIARVAGVFVHRAIPFGPDAVMNLITDITTQRRLETELGRYAKVSAHDIREPLMAIGLFVEQLAARLERGRDEHNERLVDLLRRADARATQSVLQNLIANSVKFRSDEPPRVTIAAEQEDGFWWRHHRSLQPALDRCEGARPSAIHEAVEGSHEARRACSRRRPGAARTSSEPSSGRFELAS